MKNKLNGSRLKKAGILICLTLVLLIGFVLVSPAGPTYFYQTGVGNEDVERYAEVSRASPLGLDQTVNFLYTIYGHIRDLIVSILKQTVFKGKPELAFFYGDALMLLASLTSLYVILELFTSAKKVVKLILALGWGLLIMSIVLKTGVLS